MPTAATPIPARATALVLAVLLLGAVPSMAQLAPSGASARRPPVAVSPRLLGEAREVALARSAAPAVLGAAADVYVLRRGGYARVRTGTNGHSCLVERDHPESLAPVCYDRAATRTVLPSVLRLAEMRAAGRSYRAAKAAVDSLQASRGLPTPAPGAVAYMLSRQQRLWSAADAADSRPEGAWKPHVMIYAPGVTADQTGAGPHNRAHPLVAEEGTPGAHLIVVAPAWSHPTARRSAATRSPRDPR